jgi:hypothetical protein
MTYELTEKSEGNPGPKCYYLNGIDHEKSIQLTFDDVIHLFSIEKMKLLCYLSFMEIYACSQVWGYEEEVRLFNAALKKLNITHIREIDERLRECVDFSFLRDIYDYGTVDFMGYLCYMLDETWESDNFDSHQDYIDYVF